MARLSPGDKPIRLPMTIINRTGRPIRLTGLAVTIRHAPRDCPARANLRITPSPISSTHPLLIAAHRHARLTPGQRPTIRMLDTRRNQDACQNKVITLTYTARTADTD